MTTFVWPLTAAALDNETIAGTLAGELLAAFADLATLPSLDHGELIHPLINDFESIVARYELDPGIVDELEVIVDRLTLALLNTVEYGSATPAPRTHAIDIMHEARVAAGEVRA